MAPPAESQEKIWGLFDQDILVPEYLVDNLSQLVRLKALQAIQVPVALGGSHYSGFSLFRLACHSQLLPVNPARKKKALGPSLLYRAEDCIFELIQPFSFAAIMPKTGSHRRIRRETLDLIG
jgi:hypothetical protein